MATPVVNTTVTRRGERMDRVLAALGAHLHRDSLNPTPAELLPIVFVGEDMSPAQARDLVRGGLRAGDPSCEEVVSIGQQAPERG